VAKYKIILFLEDNAQEVFIPALVERIIMDEGKVVNDYEFRILSSRGGGSIRAYVDFIKQAKKRRLLDADVLIVGSDGNCNGFLKRKQQLLNASKNIPYPEVITAVPDPHIERWYLLDGIALANAAGVPIQAVSPLGGAEYGALIAYSLDIYTAGTMDHSLRDFVDQVRSWLKRQ
jgi:hypothetical protein